MKRALPVTTLFLEVGGVLLTNGFFRIAFDLAQTPAEQVALIDNTAMFVKIKEGLGMRGSFTRITNPLAPSWPLSDYRRTAETSRKPNKELNPALTE